MMYHFKTLLDGTEIVFSEMNDEGIVKVYIEKPDEIVCFKHLSCYLPNLKIDNIYEFDEKEVKTLLDIIISNENKILTLASAQTETNYLNSNPQVIESIIKGINTPIEECLDEKDIVW